MRDELKNYTENDYWCYGITEADFEHTVNLVKEKICLSDDQIEKYKTKIYRDTPDVADDIMDDVSYYTYLDNQYLWQFCLWRLQGLLEATIVYKLISLRNSKKLLGLKTKIIALQNEGYSVTDKEFKELLLWGELRNAFSHSPPEIYRPGLLKEDDVIEYQKFISNLYTRWTQEKCDVAKIFIVDSTYDSSDDLKNSKQLKNKIEKEIDAQFGYANIGAGADLSAFVWVTITLAVFFSGKEINENLDAWVEIAEKIEKICATSSVYFNRAGAALWGLYKTNQLYESPKLISYKGFNRRIHDESEIDSIPTSIEKDADEEDVSDTIHIFLVETVKSKRIKITVSGSIVKTEQL